MPIRASEKHRYPGAKEWRKIRERILKRDNNMCAFCEVPNHAWIIRGNYGKCKGTYWYNGGVFSEKDGSFLGACDDLDYNGDGGRDIVLTVAHLDHCPENNADENLKALCQKCHLTYDAKHHAKNARDTRQARKASGDLFAEAVSSEDGKR